MGKKSKVEMHCRDRVHRDAGVRRDRIQRRDEDKFDDTDPKISALHVSIYMGCKLIFVDLSFDRRCRELNAAPRNFSIILPRSILSLTYVKRRGKHSVVSELDHIQLRDLRILRLDIASCGKIVLTLSLCQ